jgi:transcription elongation factor GreA|tara:strand:- start:569 stop:1051 length:483 start_codon:yes stop_codon:yes gene_type:complete
MSFNKVPMTVEGASALRAELEHLKKVQRPKIVADIAVAREHGDLKENAEYHAAREQQGFCEGRVQDIEGKLSHVQEIDITKLPVTDKVIFGTTVDLINIDTEQAVTYKIVGDDEADVKKNKISVNSPIARGLVGKLIGDEVSIKVPGGVVEYEIDDVKYV